MGGVIAISVLCFSTPLNAQQLIDFYLPQNPETKITNVQSEIQNTGVGGCTFDNASMNVMVWDGDEPGFAWDWNHGTEKGNQPLNIELHDPDVVVSKGSDNYKDTVFAHFVYERDIFIYYEVWSYDPTTNSWNQFVAPTQLSSVCP